MNSQQLRDDVDPSQLFNLLEGDNLAIVEEIKQVIHENLRSDYKDSWLVYALVDEYLESKSERCLDILSGIREQHDKHLFDKINECLKSCQTRPLTISLLGHIIRKQPSWLHKIASHPVMQTFLKALKNDDNVINICNAVLILVSLLPMIPSSISSHLNDIFEVFCRLIIWNCKSVGNPEIHQLHVQIAIYELFLRLYGMYPCNFLSYLRSYISTHKETKKLLMNGLKPLFNDVKMHPMLVVASKDFETSVDKWKKLEPHDVLIECAKISQRNPSVPREENFASISLGQSLSQANFIGNNSADLNNISNTAVSSPEVLTSITSITTPSSIRRSISGPNSSFNQLNTTSTNNQSGFAWNSGPLGDLSTPPPTPHTLSNSLSEFNTSNTELNLNPELEIGVEAIPSLETQIEDAVLAPELRSPHANKYQSKHSTPNNSLPSTPLRKENVFTFPTSSFELNSAPNTSPRASRQRSPKKMAMLSPQVRSSCNTSLLSNVSERSPLNSTEYAQPRPQVKIISYGIKRQQSCPDFSRRRDDRQRKYGNPRDDEECVRKYSLPTTPSKSCYGPASEPPFITPNLFPSISGKTLAIRSNLLSNFQDIQHVSLSNQRRGLEIRGKQIRSCAKDILDRYLELGSDSCGNCISMTYSDSTNWTHFGGKPPPDEISILKGESQLLRYQLLFERQKCEVHAQRNRRLLRKAKAAKALEEKNQAMNDQLLLQEKEILRWRNQSIEDRKLNQSLEKKKHESNESLVLKLGKFSSQIENLEYSNGKLKELLLLQTDENNRLKKDLDSLNSKFFNTEKELSITMELVSINSSLKLQVETLNKELVLMGELHHKYLEKYCTSPNLKHEKNYEILRDTSNKELKELKEQLDRKDIELHIQRTLNEQSENDLKNKDLIIAEQKKLLERAKISNQEKIEALQDKYSAIRNVCNQLQSHIQELTEKMHPKPKHKKGFHKVETESEVHKESSYTDSDDIIILDPPC